MTICHSLPLLELRSQPEGVIEGYASVFGGIDSYGESIVKGAFATSLERHQRAGTMPAMLWSHKQDAPIGRWSALAENGRGLRAGGKLNLKTVAGQEAFEHLRAGDLTGLSIGFLLQPEGAIQRDGVTYIKQLDLHEVSVVAIPADSAARISAVKSVAEKPATKRALEHALETLGYSRREARNIAAKGFGHQAEPEAADPQEIIAAIKAATQLLKKD